MRMNGLVVRVGANWNRRERRRRRRRRRDGRRRRARESVAAMKHGPTTESAPGGARDVLSRVADAPTRGVEAGGVDASCCSRTDAGRVIRPRRRASRSRSMSHGEPVAQHGFVERIGDSASP